VAQLLVLFDVATGLLLRVVAAPLRTHEMAQVADIHAELDRGDVLLGDRGLCSFAHLASLVVRGLHGLFRVHQRQIVDFTPGRAHVPPEAKPPHPAGWPRSRWVRAEGLFDQVVVWFRAHSDKPAWLGAEDFAALPEELTVRELRYRVEAPGFRTRVVTLVTTLVDAAAYPAAALAELYGWRWRVETDLDHLKTTMKMDVLKCKTVAGISKELAAFALVYNLVCSVQAEAGRARGVPPERVSFVDALRWWIGDDVGPGVAVVRVNPSRPGRFEPRVVKRRPKQYHRMTEPRDALRKRLLEQADAA
jgi:hypothetical protein